MGYKQHFHGIAQYWAILVTNPKPFTVTVYYIPYNLVLSTSIPAHEQRIGSLESRGLSIMIKHNMFPHLRHMYILIVVETNVGSRYTYECMVSIIDVNNGIKEPTCLKSKTVKLVKY